MLSIDADAKINLTLDILGTRADGFHEVAMVMQEIDLHDTITMEKQAKGVSLKIDGSDLPADNTNLAWRAAELVKNKYNIEEGVRILLTKRIPIAAGMAGGSTDCAAVLKGMSQLFELNLSQQELCELGAQLGSDIPFCVMGGTMLSTGRGEILKRLPDFPETWIVIAKPPIGVSTAWAYKTYDNGYDGPHPDSAAMLKAIEAGDVVAAAKLICNVLEGVTIMAHPVINEYKQLMLDNGAIASMMSGSGPTVFGIASDKQTADRIAEALKIKDIPNVYVVRTVSGNSDKDK